MGNFIADHLDAWRRDARVAGAFLTRLPFRDESADEPGALARAARAFPLVGLAVGLVQAAVLSLAGALGLPALAQALLALAAAAAVTGALHEDGLADTADGFGAGATREEKLAVMRDSRIGAYGVLALVFAIGLKVAAIASLSEDAMAAALVAAAALSRGAIVPVMGALAPARSDGLAAAAGRPDRESAVTASLLGALFALFFLGPGAGFAAVAASAAAAAGVALLARRQIGGATGDVLGAVQQAAETAALLAAAAWLP